MKKKYLFLFAFLFVFLVSALTVTITLNSPNDNYQINESTSVNFTCSSTTDTLSIENISLYLNNDEINWSKINTSIINHTGWNITDLYDSSKSKVVFAQTSNPTGFFIKSDGLKLYVVGDDTAYVYQYSLSTAWDISTASYSSKSFQLSGITPSVTMPTGIFLSSDGTKMYITSDDNNGIYQYSLSTAWDISTASYLKSFSVTSQTVDPYDLFFNSDGTKMYIGDFSNDRIFEYTLSTGWDVATASYTNQLYVGSTDFPKGVFLKSDGTKLYVGGVYFNKVYEYNLASPWDISTATLVTSKSLSKPDSLFMSSDGNYLYSLTESTRAIKQYYSYKDTSFEATFTNNLNSTTEWNCYSCITNGTCFFADSNRTVLYTIPPLNITLNLPLNQSYNSDNLTFNITAESTKAVESCQFSLDNQSNISMTTTDKTEMTYSNQFLDISETSLPIDLTTNGTYIWVTDNSNKRINKYHTNGTYIDYFNYSGNVSTTAEKPWGIAYYNDYLYISDYKFNSEINVYHANGTYANSSFYTETLIGLSIEDGIIYGVDYASKEIVKYNTNGSYISKFSTNVENSEPYGVKVSGNNLWVTDNGNFKIYKYYTNGTYIQNYTYTNAGQFPSGIEIIDEGFNTYYNIIGLTDKKIYKYYKEIFSNEYTYTNSSMTQGQHEISFFCNTSVQNSTESVYFFVDSIIPTMSNITITTTGGSQSINFEVNFTDDYLDTCFYSILNSEGNIDGLNNNVTYQCNTNQTATVSSYGSYTLVVYAQDLGGNLVTSSKLFSVSQLESSGGGGGFDTIINFEPAENFTLKTENFGDVLDFSLARGSVKELTKYFLIINTGLEPINITLSCDTNNVNESTQDIDICDYVTFPNQTVIIQPNELAPQRVAIQVLTPENATLGDRYYFNILGTKPEGSTVKFSRLSVSAGVTFLGQITKWSYLPSKSVEPIEEKAKYPVWSVALLVGFIFFVLTNVFFSRRKLPVAGFFISLFVFFTFFFVGITIL